MLKRIVYSFLTSSPLFYFSNHFQFHVSKIKFISFHFILIHFVCVDALHVLLFLFLSSILALFLSFLFFPYCQRMIFVQLFFGLVYQVILVKKKSVNLTFLQLHFCAHALIRWNTTKHFSNLIIIINLNGIFDVVKHSLVHPTHPHTHTHARAHTHAYIYIYIYRYIYTEKANRRINTIDEKSKISIKIA